MPIQPSRKFLFFSAIVATLWLLPSWLMFVLAEPADPTCGPIACRAPLVVDAVKEREVASEVLSCFLEGTEYCGKNFRNRACSESAETHGFCFLRSLARSLTKASASPERSNGWASPELVWLPLSQNPAVTSILEHYKFCITVDHVGFPVEVLFIERCPPEGIRQDIVKWCSDARFRPALLHGNFASATAKFLHFDLCTPGPFRFEMNSELPGAQGVWGSLLDCALTKSDECRLFFQEVVAAPDSLERVKSLAQLLLGEWDLRPDDPTTKMPILVWVDRHEAWDRADLEGMCILVDSNGRPKEISVPVSLIELENLGEIMLWLRGLWYRPAMGRGQFVETHVPVPYIMRTRNHSF
jgi:hypothetical protein